ncbi:histidine kinase [Neolewinella persica]|uniref:histidine kinase n=1 Tax=Neolewinella persica TaxID=70998 RepID=UPI000372DAA4|nr:two-component regulator propeller domain-containing protein [Neolewinella persica]
MPYLAWVRLIIPILFFIPAFALAQPYGFLSWTVGDGLPASEVSVLAEDALGYLWVGTDGGGVARFDGETFTNMSREMGWPGNFIKAISLDSYGAVIIHSDHGIFNYPIDSAKFTGVEMPGLITPESGPDLARAEDRLHATNPFLPVFTALGAVGKNFLAGTMEGLLLLDPQGQILEHYTAPNDLPGNRITAIITDRQGRNWIGTDGGLARMIPTGIRHFAQGEAGLAGSRITAIAAGEAGLLWLGLDRNGLQYLDSAGFARPPVDDPTLRTQITAIARDTAGWIYTATNGRGITVLCPDSLRVEQLTSRSGLPDDRLLALLPDPEGGIWAISYDQGVGYIRYEDSLFAVARYGPEEGLPLAESTSALRLPDGDLLLANAGGGILRWRPGRLIVEYGPGHGLPTGEITTMALRRNTQLWVAVNGKGLFYTDLRMIKPAFVALPSRLGPASTNIRQILLPDDRSEVWLGTDRGLEQIFLDRDGRPDWRRRYGRAEGFPAAETIAGAATCGTTDGLLYFGTSDGLVRYVPDDGDGYLPPPPTILQGISLFYAPLQPTDYRLERETPVFTATNNHFNFRFGAVDLTYPNRLRYQWQLVGADPDWSPAAAETAVRYAGLAPGRYHFKTRATTDDGKTWGEPAEFSFVITAPLWRQGWFLGLMTLVIAGLVVAGFYTFYRRIQREEARKRKRLEEKNQLLMLEQKALQLQMNPHFIFNALNGIRGLVDGQHDAEARAQITRFATLMRGILNNSRQETVALAEEISTLEEYLKMEQFCQPFEFTFAIIPPVGVEAEEVSMPSMLLQPFLENAVLHGLSAKEGAKHVEVRFLMRGRRMQCTVTDNGVGRAAAAARKAGRPAGHQSVALDVTSQRLKAMKGRLDISDVTHENGTVAGTRVELFFPVDSW